MPGRASSHPHAPQRPCILARSPGMELWPALHGEPFEPRVGRIPATTVGLPMVTAHAMVVRGLRMVALGNEQHDSACDPLQIGNRRYGIVYLEMLDEVDRQCNVERVSAFSRKPRQSILDDNDSPFTVPLCSLRHVRTMRVHHGHPCMPNKVGMVLRHPRPDVQHTCTFEDFTEYTPE